MNYYEILNVSKNATKNEIKNSYKKLVKKYHPDLYVGDKNFAEQKIKQINEAYSVLSNPEKKLAYDESLNQPLEPNSYYENANIVYNSTTRTEESVFTKFLVKKLNQLDSKRQIQIFIIIFLLTLALFLANLFHLKDYLTPAAENIVNITNTTNSISQNDTTKNTFENFDYEQNTFDDLLNDYLKSYFEEDFTNFEF